MGVTQLLPIVTESQPNWSRQSSHWKFALGNLFGFVQVLVQLHVVTHLNHLNQLSEFGTQLEVS
jgi:hypothetical protein